MTNFEFSPVGTIHIFIDGNDVVVRGEQGRTVGVLDAPQAEKSELSPVKTLEDATHITVKGPITLRVPMGTSLKIEGVADDVVLRNLGDVALESCRGDLVGSELKSFTIENSVRGDVALRKIATGMQMQDVRGDLAVADVKDVKVQTVLGDVSISNSPVVDITTIGGDLSIAHSSRLQINNIRGDVALSSVTEATSIQSVGGDVILSSPGQSVFLGQVDGDVHISGPLLPQGDYRLRVGGDVVARLSGSTRITIRALGDIIGSPDMALEAQENGYVSGLLGDEEDAADLNIHSGGDVVINSPGAWQRHQSDIVDAELKKAMREVKTELKKATSGVKVNVKRAKKGAKVDLAGLDIAEETGVSVRDIVRDLLDSLDPTTPPTPPPAPPTTHPPDPDELRLVLEMLEAGTITAEEAERLIQALKGSSN